MVDLSYLSMECLKYLNNLIKLCNRALQVLVIIILYSVLSINFISRLWNRSRFIRFRGFGLFRKGILKSKRPTGMSLCCLFTSATGYQTPPPIFLLTEGWDGMGWSVHFFFGPYLQNCFAFFLNCYSSHK